MANKPGRYSKGQREASFDNDFGATMIVLFMSGIGTLVGAIYRGLVEFIFRQKETSDISKGFRKNPKRIRYPAMLLALIIFGAAVYGLYLAARWFLPTYDRAALELLTPVEGELEQLDKLRQS